MSAIEIDSPSLIFIDVYVQALTPRLQSAEAVLQLSETITLFAICGRHTSIISKDRQVDT
jgi:hypothetical protein